jgi:hypothetical protein
MACRGAPARPRAPHPPALLPRRSAAAAAAAVARPPRRTQHARRATLPTRAAAQPIGCVYRAVAVPSLEAPYDTIQLRVRFSSLFRLCFCGCGAARWSSLRALSGRARTSRARRVRYTRGINAHFFAASRTHAATHASTNCAHLVLFICVLPHHACTAAPSPQVLHPLDPPPGGPSPVILFLGAANVPPECYAWLGSRLVAAGYAAVLCASVLRYGPQAALLPLPYDVAKLSSWELYRTGPAAEGAALVIEELRKLNDARGGALHNALDMDNIVLGVRVVSGRA